MGRTKMSNMLRLRIQCQELYKDKILCSDINIYFCIICMRTAIFSFGCCLQANQFCNYLFGLCFVHNLFLSCVNYSSFHWVGLHFILFIFEFILFFSPQKGFPFIKKKKKKKKKS